MHQDFAKNEFKRDMTFNNRLAYFCIRPKRSWFQYRYPVRIRIKAELPVIEPEEAPEMAVDPERSYEETTGDNEDGDDSD